MQINNVSSVNFCGHVKFTKPDGSHDGIEWDNNGTYRRVCAAPPHLDGFGYYEISKEEAKETLLDLFTKSKPTDTLEWQPDRVNYSSFWNY